MQCDRSASAVAAEKEEDVILARLPGVYEGIDGMDIGDYVEDIVDYEEIWEVTQSKE